jgi:pimeloyl-ACP methyl ester carboxylesterase
MSHLPEAVRESFVDTSRLRARVLESGSPELPTLVLVHGNVSSARFFAETMATLGTHFHCVAPDMRGFGGSQRLPVDARRGLSDFADDLHAVLAAVVPDRPVHLLGWSLGGGIVMRYAMDHPGVVASIVLESPMSPFGFGGTKDILRSACWPDFRFRWWHGKPGAGAQDRGRRPDRRGRHVTPSGADHPVRPGAVRAGARGGGRARRRDPAAGHRR